MAMAGRGGSFPVVPPGNAAHPAHPRVRSRAFQATGTRTVLVELGSLTTARPRRVKMKLARPIVPFLLLLCGSRMPADDPQSPAGKVRKLEREWLDAYEKRDADAMDRIVA